MNLGNYSLSEAQKIIAENPQVICAVSAPEIIQNLPLNINELITTKITEHVSEKTNIHTVSPILQGIITPFKPIPAVGTHHRRFSSLISDCARTLAHAGVKKIWFITGAPFFLPALKEGISNYRRMLPADFSYEVICWQESKIAAKITSECFENLIEFERKEAAIFMLANELKEIEIPKTLPALPFSKEEFTKWRRRGMDPEKLKKLTRKYQFSTWTNFTPSNISLLNFITDEITSRISITKL